MRPNKYLFTVIAAFLFCACAQPARKSPPPAPAVIKAAAPSISQEDVNKVESLYYKAVGSYSGNDMGAALKFLDEISAIHPSYQPAAALRKKIKSAAGSR
ncbi:MAG: hypothetical protein KKH28_03160 [Elusimicrobia bacterium]|nr:hypothetical protein [Elusimicrobiota bacterium]